MANPPDYLPISPFARLATLLGHAAPGAAPIQMALGEPQHPIPPFIAPILTQYATEFGRYPSIQGPADLRHSISGWLARRYRLNPPDPETQILPLSGTREGLFLAAFIAAQRKMIARPAILMPNPFYQCYAAAAIKAGAEPVYLNATADTGFLPDLNAVPADVLARTIALYLCSPSNPEGAVASANYWTRAFALADAHDFAILADECYAEIYDRTAPIGALEVRAETNATYQRLLVFHSLSKRSNLPGLRSGFVAGDAALISAFQQLRNVVGPTLPTPIAHASAAAWAEESHVEESRALYRAKFALARQYLGNRFAFRLPDGGFFLWLHTGDGEASALKLWREAGLRVLPGRYLAQDTGSGNPGADYIRIALVNDFAMTEEALKRLVGVL